MKYLILLMSLFLISCTSLKNVVDIYRDDNKINVEGTKEGKIINFSVKWNVEYEAPTDENGELIVTNPKTKSTFKISYKDFFIMKKAYKNWRTVEKGNPVITDTTEDGNFVYVKFNYFDEETKSILSGIFVVDTNYIKSTADQKKIQTLKSVAVGLGTYSGIMTIVCIIFAILL